jgi:hypothetical protein
MEEAKLALEWMRATDAKKSWGEPLNGWRRYFRQAKEPHVSEMRKEIRRHLTEGKRQAEMFASALIGRKSRQFRSVRFFETLRASKSPPRRRRRKRLDRCRILQIPEKFSVGRAAPSQCGRFALLPIMELKPDPSNPRKHGREQIRAIARSIAGSTGTSRS